MRHRRSSIPPLKSGQLAAQGGEEQFGLQALTLNLRGDLAGDCGIDRLERPSGRLRKDLSRTGAFEEEEIVVGVVQAFAANDDAMVAEEYDIGALHGMGDAFALSLIHI